MISRLRGTLLEKTDAAAVVEAGGVGYEVAIAPSALFRLPAPGEEVQLFIVESTAMYGGGTTLYGFPTAEDRKIFNALREHVPQTGAKKALELLEKAVKSLPDFRRAIIDKDPKVLVAICGFTPKTAEKVVAALQGRVDSLPAGAEPDAAARPSASFDEAVAGLVALGYREPAARTAAQASRDALGRGADAQALLRDSLRRLAGH